MNNETPVVIQDVGGEVPSPGARFLTLTQLQDELQINYPQALALVRTGELPAIRIGGRGVWRVERVKLEEYIEAGYQRSAANAMADELQTPEDRE